MDTYYGHVRTPADAIKLFEACRLGLLPRVQRRLSEKERQSIKSGSVFVWDEREAGMRRWTDGKSWSASRVSGSFLTYREMEGKRGGGQFVPTPTRRMQGKTPESGRGSDEDLDMDGDGPDGYRYKPDGLMKQSFSITTSTGQHLHLISYYSRPHSNSPELLQPTSDPQLRHIIPVKGMYPESTVHEAPGPAVTRTPMQQSPYMQHMQPHPPNHRGPPQYGYPGYAWPPSPVSTPPYPSHPGHYPPGPGPGMYQSNLPPPPHQHQSPYPQPSSAHASPYQNQPPPNQQHQSPQNHHPHHPQSHQQHPAPQTPYDRPPPPLSDSSLPPPPPLPRGMSTATAANLAHGMSIPHYAPNPSPRIEQARLIAEQQAVAARALQASLANVNMNMDPRLTAPAVLAPVRNITPPHNQNQNQNQGQSLNQGAGLGNLMGSQNGTPPSANGSPSRGNVISQPQTSQAQSIPSISSLVHATDSVSVMSDNKSNSNLIASGPNGNAHQTSSPTSHPTGPAKPNSTSNPTNGNPNPASNGTQNGQHTPQNTSRPGSKSPQSEDRARDIPHEKLHIGGEDQRAIRVLDRKFVF